MYLMSFSYTFFFKKKITIEYVKSIDSMINLHFLYGNGQEICTRMKIIFFFFLSMSDVENHFYFTTISHC
jgi:hypothetical protein